MRRTLAFLLLLAGCTGSTPGEVVERFYAANAGMAGAPTPEQLAVLAPFLSDSLHDRLVRARKIHDDDLLRAPGDKPSFTDGDLFASLFEGPTAVTVDGDSADAGRHLVRAHMTFVQDSQKVNWVDTIVLVRERGQWLIDDIRYGGRWPLSARGLLSERLQ